MFEYTFTVVSLKDEHLVESCQSTAYLQPKEMEAIQHVYDFIFFTSIVTAPQVERKW